MPEDISYGEEEIENIRETDQLYYECRYTPDFTGKIIIEIFSQGNLKVDMSIEICDSEYREYFDKVSTEKPLYFSKNRSC